MSELLDRTAETAALEGVLAKARDGLGGVLVLRGDPGIGKTMLLEWAAGQARDMRLVRVAGVEAETGMGFAGLHQLLVPFLGELDGLPEPQRQALGSAFGLLDGPPPDRFLVGLAALTLLTDVAAERPLLVAVDDAQWLDQASVEVLGFIARRLHADRVGMVFTVRDGEEGAAALAGLPELLLSGLSAEAARRLLAASAGVRVDGRVSAQLVAGAAGNPLALAELAGELTAEELSGAVRLAWPLRFSGRLEELYLSRVRALPDDTRTVLLVAAADRSGDPVLVGAAAGRLGASPEAGEAEGAQRLVAWHPRVRFRHPVVRSAAYFAASAGARRAAHAELAEVTDPQADPDRRAWHLAEAAVGPDERVAAELERSAGRAQARGGLASAAAFLERSAELTLDPAQRVIRTLAAAQASMQAGALGRALDLLATAEAGTAGPLDESAAGRIALLRGHIAFAANIDGGAPSLLLKAAERLAPRNPELARQAYLSAWGAASMAGHQAGADLLLEISCAARALPPPVGAPRPVDLILDGLTLLTIEGPAAAAPALRRAVKVFTTGDMSREDGLRWGWMAAGVLWDVAAAHAIMARQVQFARAAGALEELAFDLVTLAQWDAWRGDFAGAAALLAEADAAAEVTGTCVARYARMFLATLQGNEADLTGLLAAGGATDEADGRGLGATAWSQGWACLNAAILCNGLGRYDDAYALAGQAREHKHLYLSLWALPELIEAAARTGRRGSAAAALDVLAESTQIGGTDFGLGLEARSRAFVIAGEAAEHCYREAIERLSRTQHRPDLARSHLLYGEWLRRQRRRRDARDQLRAAFEMFDSMGMAAFADRARTELRATGEQARPPGPGAPRLLTPQEEQIARLVAEHLSNPEIAARLFISASTVEYHLAKIFRKLGVAGRAEVARSLKEGNKPAVIAAAGL